MDEHRSPQKKTRLFILTVFVVDIIFCTIILILLAISLHQNYQPEIYHNKYVERISLASSVIGFFLAIVLLLKIQYFGSTFRGALLFLQICILGGVLHLICALALFFYYATSWGMLLIVLGHIYRDYGYLQFACALFYLGIFVYFIGRLRPSASKG